VTTRKAVLLGGVMALVGSVLVGIPSRAQELRVAQASGAASPELLERGRVLFNDVGLSADGKWACATCHPSDGHTDNKTYVGVTVVADGDPNGRSTPTLWGAGFRRAYSWAGTAPSLEANIRGIIVNRMKGAEPSPETLAALAAYVRSLPYPENPNLKDDGSPSDAAPAAAKRGYEIFMVKAGSRTAPYFHDGRYATLEPAVQAMWEYVQKAGTSEKLTDDDLRDLVEYLKIL
jgi:cytochrome c peroxidase